MNNSYYRANSIRIANYQRKMPGDIGKFRPQTETHTLYAFQNVVDADDDAPNGAYGDDVDAGAGWFVKLPFGSSIGPFESDAKAIQAGHQWMVNNGWTQDEALADIQSIEHAHARAEKRAGKVQAHPNRNWRSGWEVDAANLTATHTSGLRIIGKRVDDGIDVEVEQASMPIPASGSTPEDILALGRDLGRRCEEGGRLLLEALQK